MVRCCIIIFLLIPLVGCNIGKEEINDLAMVMAVGIDKADDNNLLLTAQIAKPGSISGETGGGGGEEPVWTATATGETIFGAIRNLARFSTRRVFWAHNFIIVISEKVAREEGIVDIIDFFNRNNELRMRTWVVVTEKDASEIVGTQTGLESVPGISLDRLFRFNRIVAEAPSTDVMRLTKMYVGEITQPYLAMVKLTETVIDPKKADQQGSIPQVELSGTAIFNNDKMVGKLTPEETRGFLWFVESVESQIIPLKCPEESGQVSIELRDNTFDITPKYENGKVSFHIQLDVRTDLVELGCPTDLEHSEIMEKLQGQVEEEFKKQIELMLAKVQQEYQTDVVSFGRLFYGKFPKQWKEIEDDWAEIFPTVETTVTVSAELNNPLLLENPTRPAEDG